MSMKYLHEWLVNELAAVRREFRERENVFSPRPAPLIIYNTVRHPMIHVSNRPTRSFLDTWPPFSLRPSAKSGKLAVNQRGRESGKEEEEGRRGNKGGQAAGNFEG